MDTEMQPKIIGGFGSDEQRGGGDKATKQIHLNGGISMIRYGMDGKNNPLRTGRFLPIGWYGLQGQSAAFFPYDLTILIS